MAGNWQGSLQAGGRELRIVVKVTKANDALKAVMYSIDQGGPVLPASAFTLQGSTVKMAVAGLAANYAGKLSADGNSIAGTWTQGPNPRLFFRGLGVLPARNATMSDLAGVMQNAVLDRPVVDQTGIAGRYDFTLTWTPDEFQFRGLGARIPLPTDSATAPPDLFVAIQQQLGLKLESTKALAEVFVVDRVEKPTGN